MNSSNYPGRGNLILARLEIQVVLCGNYFTRHYDWRHLGTLTDSKKRQLPDNSNSAEKVEECEPTANLVTHHVNLIAYTV